MLLGLLATVGDAPFSLPEPESVRAAATNGAVEMTLYAIFEGHGAHLLPVQVTMTPKLADQLAQELIAAAFSR